MRPRSNWSRVNPAKPIRRNSRLACVRSGLIRSDDLLFKLTHLLLDKLRLELLKLLQLLQSLESSNCTLRHSSSSLSAAGGERAGDRLEELLLEEVLLLLLLLELELLLMLLATTVLSGRRCRDQRRASTSKGSEERLEVNGAPDGSGSSLSLLKESTATTAVWYRRGLWRRGCPSK